MISGCRRTSLARVNCRPLTVSGPWGGSPPGSGAPGPGVATTTASVLGLRCSRRDTRPANHESSMHIPMWIGEITITTGMNGKS